MRPIKDTPDLYRTGPAHHDVDSSAMLTSLSSVPPPSNKKREIEIMFSQPTNKARLKVSF